MFEENVVSSAGTTFCTNAAGIESRIRAAGFKAEEERAVRLASREPAQDGASARSAGAVHTRDRAVIHADALIVGDGAPILDGAVVVDEGGEVIDVGTRCSTCSQRTREPPSNECAGRRLFQLVNAHIRTLS